MTAMSTFSPVGSRSSNGMRMCVCVCVCVCVDGMNLKYTVHWHIHISVHSILCQCYTQAHAHTHPQTILEQQTDWAKSGYCPAEGLSEVGTGVFQHLQHQCIYLGRGTAVKRYVSVAAFEVLCVWPYHTIGSPCSS